MSKDIIYIRTEKGERTLVDRGDLAPGLDKILGSIDGRSTVEAIRSRLDTLSAGLLDFGLEALVESDLIRDASGAPPAASPTPVEEHTRKAQELRDKIRDRRKGGDRSRSSPAIDAWYQARREAEALATREAEEQAKRLGEEQAKRAEADLARKVLDEQNKRIAADQARRAAEEQAKRALDELAKREAEDKARLEAEERARRAAEEQAKRAIEELAKREAEDKARREAEEQARRAAAEEAQRREEERLRQEAEETQRREAERTKQEAAAAERLAAEEAARAAARDEEQREAAERARQRAEVQARLMAEEQEWQAVEEKARVDEAAAKAREQPQAGSGSGKSRSGPPRNIAKLAGLGLGGLLVAGLAALHVIPFDGQIPQFEQVLTAQFQQPVKIKSIRLALIPGSHVRLEGVTFGADGQIRVPVIRAGGSLGNLFSDKKDFKAIELDAPIISEEGLGWILFGQRQGREMGIVEVSATGASLASKGVSLPAFDAKLQFGSEGAWKTVALTSVDKNMEMLLTSKGASAQIEIRARSFKVPFGSTLTLEEFSANGSADRNGLAISDFKGFAYGGTLGGTANVKWGAAWSLAGELNARQVDMERFVPGLMSSARLEGKASYSMQASEPGKLFDWARAEGNFSIPRGTLLGLDLGSVLQGGGLRGETKFSELTGSFVHDQGATQLRQLRMSQSNMAASGSVDVGVDKKVRGKFATELRLSTEVRRSSLSVSGTLGKLEWQR
jgi:actin-related protein